VTAAGLAGDRGRLALGAPSATPTALPALRRSVHLNTLLAPVSWELIEPAEHRFDFILSMLSAGARSPFQARALDQQYNVISQNIERLDDRQGA
jgi:hypothetical protein